MKITESNLRQIIKEELILEISLQGELLADPPAAVTIGAEVLLGFTPAGVVIDFKDLAQAIEERDPVFATMAGIGFIPVVGDLFKVPYKVGRASAKQVKALDKLAKELGPEGIEQLSKRGGQAGKASRVARAGFSLAADKSKSVFRLDTAQDGQVRDIVIASMPDGSAKALMRSTGASGGGYKGSWIPIEGFSTYKRIPKGMSITDSFSDILGAKTYWNQPNSSAKAPAGSVYDKAGKWIDEFIKSKGGDDAVFGNARVVSIGSPTSEKDRKVLGAINRFLYKLGAIDRGAGVLRVTDKGRRLQFGLDEIS